MAKQETTAQHQQDVAAEQAAAQQRQADQRAAAAGAPLRPDPFEFVPPKAADGPPPTHEETLGSLQGAPKALADEYAKTGKTPAGPERDRLVEQANRVGTNESQQQNPPAGTP